MARGFKKTQKTLLMIILFRSSVFIRNCWCVNSFFRACVRVFVFAFVRSCLSLAMWLFVNSFVRSFMRVFVHAFIHWFLRGRARARECMCVRACVRAFVRSFVRSFSSSNFPPQSSKTVHRPLMVWSLVLTSKNLSNSDCNLSL